MNKRIIYFVRDVFDNHLEGYKFQNFTMCFMCTQAIKRKYTSEFRHAPRRMENSNVSKVKSDDTYQIGTGSTLQITNNII